MKLVKKAVSVGMLSLAIILSVSTTVSAHVTVRPSEVKTSERVTFAVSVPNEHDTPVVGVRLVIPEGLSSVRPFAKAGWNIEITKTGEGENVTATEIKWTSAGGTVPVDLKDDFLFGAMAPAEATELQWKAYETYADGTEVAWDQTPSEDEGNKPFSVTKVVMQTEAEASLQRVEQAVVDADKSADRAFSIAILALIVSITGIVWLSRSKNS